jgi:type I restriction enzyme, S subunit
LASEWRQSKLKDEADILLGFAFRSAEFVTGSGSYRLLRGDNIKRGSIEWGEKTRYWCEPTADLLKYRLIDGDVVIGMDGSRVGENFARVSTDDLPALLVQRVACLRARSNLYQEFLRYLICNPRFTAYVRAVHTGTSIPHISGGQIGDYPIVVPPINEQVAIAHILGTLDEKIELNRRMSETLEAMAQALFKSWFVDFDPVRDKAEGRDPGLPQPLADLFPARFVESELGKIPEGWQVKQLPDIMAINPPRRLRRGEVAPYLDMSHMPTTSHSPEKLTQRAFGSGMRFQNGDTLVARITPCLENGKTAFVDFLADGQIGWGSTEYIVLRPKSPVPPQFAYCLARSDEFREFAIQGMTGSSGRQRVQAASLSHFLLVAGGDSVNQAFGGLVGPLLARARTATTESLILATLRNALLPKLISAEIRLRNSRVGLHQDQS